MEDVPFRAVQHSYFVFLLKLAHTYNTRISLLCLLTRLPKLDLILINKLHHLFNHRTFLILDLLSAQSQPHTTHTTTVDKRQEPAQNKSLEEDWGLPA